MTKSVKWNLNVYVEGGPSLSSSEDMHVDAVDVVSIKVPKAVSSTVPGSSTVDVQPGDLKEVQFLYIKSDLYDGVTYKFIDGTSKTADVELDKDHVLTSGKLVNLFKFSPKQVEFTNGASTDANVEIVVARSATGP